MQALGLYSDESRAIRQSRPGCTYSHPPGTRSNFAFQISNHRPRLSFSPYLFRVPPPCETEPAFDILDHKQQAKTPGETIGNWTHTYYPSATAWRETSQLHTAKLSGTVGPSFDMGLSAGQLSLCVISASSVLLIMKQFGARDAQPGGQRITRWERSSR